MTVDPTRIAGMNRHETDHLVAEILGRRAYLPAPLRLPPGSVVLDVGANIGVYSLFALAECPDATVYACEPVPEVAAVLRANLAGHARAHVLPIGLSDVDEEVEFVHYPGYTTMSAQRAHADPEIDKAVVRAGAGPVAEDEADLLADLIDHRFRETRVRARVRRLSALLVDLGLDRVDMLKIDVQRAEAAVLSGIDAADWPKIRQLVMEVHDAPGPTAGRLVAVTAGLRARGYTVRAEQDPDLAGSDRHTVIAHRSAPGQ